MAASRNKLSADLPRRVGAFLATRVLPGERLSVGLSGGCDSIVLLHVLANLGFADRLDAIHVHHGISPNADAWAGFCIAYCQRLGVPIVVRRVNVELDSGKGLEAAARESRYEVFAEVANDCLLLAHHRGDQAETVLFNLLRGSGVRGAAGMPAERRLGKLRLLRPFLDVARAEIEAYAGGHGLQWIDDESNLDMSFSRNYLRHDILLALGQRFPAAESALASAARHFGEALELLDDIAQSDWATVCDDGGARLSDLRCLSVARQKNLLRYRLQQMGWQAPVASRLAEFVRQLQVAAPDRHPELILPNGRMRVARGVLHWLPER